jgi:hypothetical protein
VNNTSASFPEARISHVDPADMPLEEFATFRRYRAPQEDGQTFFDAAWPELPAVVGENRAQVAAIDYDLQGCSLTELSTSARRRLIGKAIEYASRYQDPPALPASASWPTIVEDGARQLPIVLSGHQPQLYHPGVWFKNFALGALARRVGGVGIHLLIDSDLCRSVSIRVPTGTLDRPEIETIPYDLPASEVAYEERLIRDRNTFDRFGERVTAAIRPFVDKPLVEELWPLVCERSLAHGNLGLSIAQGRHMLEAAWGHGTLELPQSAVCQLPEFTWFVVHLLAHLPRFRDAYNGALAAYRAAHRLRNRAQPVPDLGAAGDWLEAPFWMWTTDNPTRRPLFARVQPGRIEISNRGERTVSLTVSRDGDAGAAVEQLLSLAINGVKIRTRALATTLFARLMLGDIFLHGIGGAKYDQVTNLIARQFFGFELPQFATVSATLRLPVAQTRSLDVDSTIPQRLRELRFHPERFLEANGVPAEEMSKVTNILATKRQWIETAAAPGAGRQRHAAITAANEALQPYVDSVRRRLERERDQQEDQRRASAVLNSREYAFCLFPLRHFQDKLLDDLAVGS